MKYAVMNQKLALWEAKDLFVALCAYSIDPTGMNLKPLCRLIGAGGGVSRKPRAKRGVP